MLGGGVIGLFSAYMLRREGLQVALIAGGEPRRAASWGNAGFVCPGYGSPTAEAESLLQLIRWKLGRESPIKLSTLFLLRESMPGGWLYRFIRRHTTILSHAKELKDMARDSLALFEQVVKEERLDVGYYQRGVMEVFQDKKKLDMELEEARENAKLLGTRIRELSGEECIEEEPLLSRNVRGGILFEEDAWANPAKVVMEMRRIVREKGVAVIEGEAASLEHSNGRVVSAKIGREHVKSENFIVACGAHSPALLASLVIKLPIASGYGYAIKLAPTNKRIKRPLVLGDYHITATQTEEGNLRSTGFFELAYMDIKPRESRFEYLRRNAAKYIAQFGELEVVEKWYGARPCSPDAIPLVGRLKGFENLYVAAGHCRLGLTLAAVTGSVIADLVAGRENRYAELLSPSRLGL